MAAILPVFRLGCSPARERRDWEWSVPALTRRATTQAIALVILFWGSAGTSLARPLVLREDSTAGTISVFRAGESTALLTQNAASDSRPYLHPLVAPDGKGVLTELSPAHHRHQTGIYWGLTRVNGRDYFTNPGAGFWRRVS